MKNKNAVNDMLAEEVRALRRHNLAIALDFDGVCKLFTGYKHQIMATCLFLHLPEFQRAPYDAYRRAYVYINFRSADYAGKARFLCVNALAEHLAAQGYDCSLPQLHRAVAAVRERNLNVDEKNLLPYADKDQVARTIAWSREVNERVALLNSIGLTPGLRENILTPFRNHADYYIVSTATEEPLRDSLQGEDMDFIRRYIGQETAPKAQALKALGHAGYRSIVFFGDSVEDARAARAAAAELPQDILLCFAPVIPGAESDSFRVGREVIDAMLGGDSGSARKLCSRQQQAFKGHEAGMGDAAPPIRI